MSIFYNPLTLGMMMCGDLRAGIVKFVAAWYHILAGMVSVMLT